MKFVLSPDIILRGWLGSKHQQTNQLSFSTKSNSGELQTQKLMTPLLRTQNSKVFPLMPVVGQIIAMHVLPTGRDFFLTKFYLPGPFTFIFFQILFLDLLVVVVKTHKRLKRVLFNQTKQDRMQIFKEIPFFKAMNNAKTNKLLMFLSPVGFLQKEVGCG